MQIGDSYKWLTLIVHDDRLWIFVKEKHYSKDTPQIQVIAYTTVAATASVQRVALVQAYSTTF